MRSCVKRSSYLFFLGWIFCGIRKSSMRSSKRLVLYVLFQLIKLNLTYTCRFIMLFWWIHAKWINIYGKLLKVLSNKMKFWKDTWNRNNDMCLTEDVPDWSSAKLFSIDPRKWKIQLPWTQPYPCYRCTTRILLG